MRYWFIPCFSGDFRLERVGQHPDSHCKLTVENPTPLDRQRLDPFLAAAKQAGWLDTEASYSAVGTTTLPVQASMREAGPVLAELSTPEGERERWTALRHATGTKLTTDQAELARLIETGAVQVRGDRCEIVAAVTIKAPTKGCPPPMPTPRRAAEVLRAFCTSYQVRSFERDGVLRAYGHMTGRPYRIYHRDEAARRGLGHTLVDVLTGREMCVWDDTVPAEEEVLALKLAVEHREPWLLGRVA